MTDTKIVCKFCGGDNLLARVEIGVDWCKNCTRDGLRQSKKIVLVCGHKSGYQPMFIEDVVSFAKDPKRSY